VSDVNRVVVTGLGAVSPVGQTAASYWTSLKQGVCGIGPIELFMAEELSQKAGAQIKDFDPRRHFDDRQISMLDRSSQFAVVAAREAIAQAGVVFDDQLSLKTAVVVGSGAAGQFTTDESFYRIYRENKSRVFPLTVPKLMVNAPASQISMQCGLRGPAFVIASACASATHAIGIAFHMVRSGQVACAVTGGTEACITFGGIRAWEAMRVMAPDTCRPFSKERRGLVMGEGAEMEVLETLEGAQARGAEILGEIVGFGMGADAGDLTAPDRDGMARAMTDALADARLAPQDVHYINAHGTGTAANDLTETQAIKQVFGDHARKVPISSTKSMVGHALGAAGALELVATLMAMRDGIVPPTINYLGPDPECDLDYVPNDPRAMPIDAALSNSFAFGGLNAVLAMRKLS
jgi:nodulation protein E